MNTDDLTVEQLRELQRRLYQQAGDDGTLRLLRLVAMELGEPVPAKYGPKWMWTADDVYIYRDDYGGYTTVSYKGQPVCSTHQCGAFFAPGPWVELVKKYAARAVQQADQRDAARNERERQELLHKLGLLPPPELPMGDVLEDAP